MTYSGDKQQGPTGEYTELYSCPMINHNAKEYVMFFKCVCVYIYIYIYKTESLCCTAGIYKTLLIKSDSLTAQPRQELQIFNIKY